LRLKHKIGEKTFFAITFDWTPSYQGPVTQNFLL
jgi:hypothetical protein